MRMSETDASYTGAPAWGQRARPDVQATGERHARSDVQQHLVVRAQVGVHALELIRGLHLDQHGDADIASAAALAHRHRVARQRAEGRRDDAAHPIDEGLRPPAEDLERIDTGELLERAEGAHASSRATSDGSRSGWNWRSRSAWTARSR